MNIKYSQTRILFYFTAHKEHAIVIMTMFYTRYIEVNAVFMSYLRYLCLFAYSGVKHILCCVFVLVLPVSLDCPFLIAPSVLCLFREPYINSLPGL